MNSSTSPCHSSSLQIDPFHMCQPLGAIYAATGIHACLPLSHASSGCSRYQRMEISQHFRKKIRVVSSLLKEAAAVFGGSDHLMQAVHNSLSVYSPEILAVHTTCLSETIGDDLDTILKECSIPEGHHVVFANTPGYSGSHITGYANMIRAILTQLPTGPLPKENRLFIIPGLINPSDIHELKRMISFFSTAYTMCPDVSNVLDLPTPQKEQDYVSGGTPYSAIASAGACNHSIALGQEAAWPGAAALQAIGVEPIFLDLPIGLEATDQFLHSLHLCTNHLPDPQLERERLQLVEAIMQLHPLLYQKKVALCCDPDIAVPLTQFLTSMGMQPIWIGAGCAESTFEARIQAILDQYQINGVVDGHTDFYQTEQFLKQHPVDLLIGDTKAKLLAKRLNVPLFRVGFPVTDRPLYHYFPIVGYRGALFLLQQILQVLLQHQEEGCTVEELDFMVVI